MARPVPPLSDAELDAYLRRLQLTADQVAAVDREQLDRLSLAHLVNVPFENLDLVFAGGTDHDLDRSVTKVLSGRGGWCFELNGAFARLLASLGLEVRLIGCAVLLDGPSDVVEHLALEVAGGPSGVPPLLVDVGFGDSFVTPLELNRSGPQPGGNGDYELIPSPKGTTLTRLVDGVPAATLRFKRVALDFDDFATAAHDLQHDSTRQWSRTPFATRLVTVDERITLRGRQRNRSRLGDVEREPVIDRTTWDATLHDWFGMQRPGPWPTERSDSIPD